MNIYCQYIISTFVKIIMLLLFHIKIDPKLNQCLRLETTTFRNCCLRDCKRRVCDISIAVDNSKQYTK